MNFGSPLGLWLFALTVPIVAFYLLKVKRRQVVVPYLRLWRDLVVETTARSLFQRLRRLFSLLLQLLILAGVVLALSEPSVDLKAVKKESVLVLLDVSASMQSQEAAGKSRFELLRDAASEWVEGRSFEDEMMLAAVSDRIEVLTPFTRSTLELRDGLKRLTPTQRSLEVDALLAFAREMTAGKSDPVVVVLSDGNGGSLKDKLSALNFARWIPIGMSRANLAITRFATRKNEALGTDFVLAEVANHGEETQEVRLEISLDGSTRKVITRSIEPSATIHEELQLTLPAGGLLSLGIRRVPPAGQPELDPLEYNALAIDDTAFAMVRPTRLRRVLVVTATEAEAQPYWLALTSMAEWIHESSKAVLASDYDQLSAEDKRADITICGNVLPPNLDPTTNLVLLHSDLPTAIPAKIAGDVASPKVFDWEREHELNRYLNYRDLPLPATRILEIDSGTPLVSTIEGPIVAAFELTNRRAIYVGFDMTAELFPFRLAFPLLLRNALAWFEAEEDAWFEPTYRVSQSIRPLERIAEGAQVTVRYADGAEVKTEPLTVQDGSFVFRGTDQIGPVEFTIGGATHPTCVNLFDALESNIAPGELPASTDPATEQGRHLLNRELWTLLALGALVLWAIEWLTYHRRITE